MIQYFLDGQPCNPKDSELIDFELDFRTKRQKRIEPSVSTVTFVREDRQRVVDFITQYSTLEGMPFDIQMGSLLLQYELDFTTESFEKGDTFVVCEFRRRRGLDSFFKNADSTSWRIVDFQPGDFRSIEYIVKPNQQGLYFISLSLALLSLRQEIAKSVQEVQEGIADVVKASVPVGAPPAPDWGAIIVASIKLAARIAYFIFIFAALISTVLDIIRLIFPLVREFKCIGLKRMVEVGCQELGYTLESNLLDSLEELTIIPVPLNNPDKTWFREVFMPQSLAYTLGYPTERDVFPYFGDVLEFIENTFNAEIKVSNGVVKIENESYFLQNPSGVKDAAFNLVPDNETVVRYNNDDQFKRKIFVQAIDSSDVNTMDDTNDTILELRGETITSPHNLSNLRNVLKIEIDTARATNKGKLNIVEKFAKTIAKAVDVFTGGSLASNIADRVNIMQVSDQYFTRTKWAWMQGKRLHPDQNKYIGMSAIYNNYHISKNNENNLKEITEKMPQALNMNKFFNIEQNNYVTLNGEVAKILYVKFNEWDRFAEIDYEKRVQNNNVITTVI
jgi:hypothetical protein